MATIKVNSTVIEEKANNFKTAATTIKGQTEQMTTQVEKLRSYWEGDAAEATIKQFTALASKFEEIVGTIENYGTYLSEVAEAYRQTEMANSGAQ